jgi:hypothetical protein
MYTLRATARLRLADGTFSDLSRSASALVTTSGRPAFRIVRWHDRL